MIQVRITNDLDECRELWEKHLPRELISDLWEVRDCFHSHYRHLPHFVTAEYENRLCGLLPLVWNKETGQYNYFPGETWEGKSWLEQNRIIASDREVLDAMLDSLTQPYHLRYLRTDSGWNNRADNIDELGYLFAPQDYDYDLSKYYEEFSHKTAKRMRRELAAWEARDLKWRFNDPDDFDNLIQMNRSRFGRLSYFYDERFLESFRSLMMHLCDHGWLRMVTILVNGESAAIDMGSLYRNRLTMLAGGTNQNFPGIAKLINMHHMEYACDKKLECVDFLCGDFNWKTLFHLKPEPLYLLDNKKPAEARIFSDQILRPSGWRVGLIRQGSLYE